MQVPEHTWGVDTKEFPGDYQRWSNADLAQALHNGDERFVAAVESWKRQRQYNEWAVRELGEGGGNYFAVADGIMSVQRPHFCPMCLCV